MPVSYGQLTEQLADQVLAGLKRIEGAVAGSTEKVASLAAKAPDLPKVPLAGRFTDRLPSPSEITEANFAIVARLLDAQKHYALRVIGAASPKSGVQATASPRAKATATSGAKATSPTRTRSTKPRTSASV